MVVAIIAVLASLLFPAFRVARERAKTVACANNLRQIGVAVVLYAGDYDRRYPIQFYDKSTTRTDPAMSFMKVMPSGGNAAVDGGTGGYNCWLWLLYPYHKNGQLYICPSAKEKGRGWTYGMSMDFTPVVTASGVVMNNRFNFTPWPVLRGSEVYRENKILVADGRAGLKTPNPFGTTGAEYTFFYSGYQDSQHNGGCNLLFIDGHVECLPATAIPLDRNVDGNYSWQRPDIPSIKYP